MWVQERIILESNELSAHHVKKNVLHLFDLEIKELVCGRLVVVVINLDWNPLPLTNKYT